MQLPTPRAAPRAWWALLVILLTAVILVGVNVAYTTYQQRTADRRWCALLTSLDQPGVPPTTDRGRQIQQQIHQLRRDLKCGGKS